MYVNSVADSVEDASKSRTYFIHPLSSRDAAFEGLSPSVSFALTAESGELDLEGLERAIGRVVDKWRLLAGRIYRNEADDTWAIRVPLGPLPLDYRTHIFSTTNLENDLSPLASSPPLSSTSAHLVPVPSVDVAHPHKLPLSFKAFVAQDSPLTSWHVVVYKEVTIISFQATHILLDATGCGLVLQALDSELNGKDWTPPPMREENLHEKRIRQIREMEFTDEEKANVGPSMLGWTGTWPPASIAKFILSEKYERYWHKAEEGSFFLGKDLLEGLIRDLKVKVQTETGGKEYVSTADVLTMFLFQSLYRYDPSRPSTFITSIGLSEREVLSTDSINLRGYPHNAISNYAFSDASFSVETLLSTPLHELALMNRRALLRRRTLAGIRAVEDWVSSTCQPGWPVLPLAEFESNDTIWFTNQIEGGMPKISFPSSRDSTQPLELKGFFEWVVGAPNFFALNELEKGWVLTGVTRRSRWKSLEKSARELEGKIASA